MSRANRLSPLDASFLYWERPNHRLHVGCVALLDGPIPFAPFVEAMEGRLGAIPRYRERPVRPFLDLDWPRWEADPAFELRRHLRHVAVPAPGGERELHELVDALFATRLDPRHPLWENYLIDGLAGGRAALLCKVHHSMIDGVSGAEVLEVMADPAPHAPPPPQGVHAEAPRSLRDAFRPGALVASARDTLQAFGTMASLLFESVPRLSFNGPITDARRIVWATFALDDFLTIRGAAGCKVNDVVLAVIAGAIRRYVLARGVAPEAIQPRTLVPVSIRRAEDRMTLGNRVSSMFPRLPIDVADPAERLRRIAAEMRALKERGQPRATALALELLGTLPAPVNALIARLLPATPPINTICTNVPGPREPLTLLGRRILEIHPIVPLFQGVGLEFGILSYAGQVSISAAVDPHLVPDAADIPSHLHAELEDLRGAFGGLPARPEIPAAAVRVADLMTRDLVTIGPGDVLARAYREMRLHRIRHVPVTRSDGVLVGLVTHRDLLAVSSSSLVVPEEEERVRLLGLVRAQDVMETHVSVAGPDDDASAAGVRMIRYKIGCLPVIETSGRLVGIVTEADFLRWATARMAPPEPARQTA
jgi:WS/DGAT/MGAT family acyltransferase